MQRCRSGLKHLVLIGVLGLASMSQAYLISPFNSNAILFSGNANRDLAHKIAEHLRVPLGEALVGTFNDGEVRIQVGTNVRNKDVFIVQPACPTLDQSINDTIMELYLMIRTMVRASAGSINVVIPYYGYARQDRKLKSRVPISASDIAYLLEKAGATRVMTIDLHCGQIQGFFQNIPVDNLCASIVFAPYVAAKSLSNVVVVSPDAGGVERATEFLDDIVKRGMPARMAVISKRREGAGVIGSMHLIGDVDGADAIIVDDLCDTGGTLVKAAELLKEHGAKRVFAVITHPVFSKNALDTIANSVIDEIVIADTIPLRGEAPANMTVISVAPLLAEAIFRIELGESVSGLFK